jgi:hypothetical protein
MRSLLHSKRTVLALSFNGIVLLLILLAVSSREKNSFGQLQPVAVTSPTAGLTVMPAQLSATHWGCYVLDSQNQTLSVYEYSPGETMLKFSAARDIEYDRKLGFFNTTPSPSDIRKMIERAEEPPRAAPTTEHAPESAPQ